VDWKKIKAEYIAGGTSYRKLAEKYGVPRTTLERKAKEERWTELRRQAECKAEAKIVNAVSEKKASIDDKYFRLVDMLMDKAELLILTTHIWQPTMLKEMATTMKYLKECKGVKSEADIREQEARIAKLQREAERDDDATHEIEVVFNAGEEAWNE
jgi:transposase-like protein